MTMRAFIQKIDDFKARLRASEGMLGALAIEKEMLRVEATEYMRVSAFDAEMPTFSFRFTWPEGDEPAAPTGEQPGDPAIVRHPGQAA